MLTKGINIGDPRDLEVCTHILVVTDATWRPLQPTYEDPYKVFERGEHSFRLDIGGKLKRPFRLAPFLQGIDATGGSLSARLVLISATQRLRSTAHATGFLARKPLGSVGSGVLWQNSIPSSHRPRSILFIFRYDFSWYWDNSNFLSVVVVAVHKFYKSTSDPFKRSSFLTTDEKE